MRPSDILILSRTINPKEYLSDTILRSLSEIKVESPRKNTVRKTPRRNDNRRDPVKKTTFKKKAESFDDAMRMKIVADLNKLTDKNYDVIQKQIHALYSRISSELKGNVLKLIIENSTKQHIYAKEYMRMFMDLIKDVQEERTLGSKILHETMSTHIRTILTELTNGESYDDFCEANKVKVSRIGLSIVIGEASNLNMISPQNVGQHAINLLQTMEKIRENASTINKEAIDNQTECVLMYFRVIAKTKILREGFQKCIMGFDQILQREKAEKKLNPKSRFALMDFVDEMKKNHEKAKKEEERKKSNVYIPRSFRGGRTIA
jgi:hypothetical protein